MLAVLNAVPYKIKYWWEYYLSKHIERYCDKAKYWQFWHMYITIGELNVDEFI